MMYYYFIYQVYIYIIMDTNGKIHQYYTINVLRSMTIDAQCGKLYPSYASIDLKIYLEGVFHYISECIKDGNVIVPRNLHHATDPTWDEYLSDAGLVNQDWNDCIKFFTKEGYAVTDKKSHLIIEWTTS
jgi:hypothetical protein